MTRPKITLADVAARAAVSSATASKALNTARDVSGATRERVRRAARELGYAGASARRRPRIQVVADTLGNPYTPFVLQGLLDEATERGIDVAIALRHGRWSQPHEPGSANWIADIADDGFAGAVLITLPVGVGHASVASARGVALVAIDPASPIPSGVRSVRPTNHLGAHEATRHLIDLGHVRIGTVLGRPGAVPTTQRLEGYRAALASAGLASAPDLIADGDFRYESGLVAGTALLRRTRPPTAIFAHNDPMAMGVMEAARRLGRRVPEDLSIVGFDDVESARWSTPPLTTVRQPLEDIGGEAVRMLDGALRGVRTRGRQLRTRLVVRGSTAPPR